MIYQDINFKICLSLFGWKENIVPKMHIVECYVPALVNLLVLVLLANVMLGLGYWMSQDLPFFAFLHTALVFVELSKWASTEPARRE